MLGDRKRKCAPSKFRAICFFMQTLEDQVELISRICCLGEDGVQRADYPLMAILKIGRDEMILGWKMPVERCLGDLGLIDDAIDAHSADTLSIEKRAGRRKNVI